MLTTAQIDGFISDGFVRVDGAFTQETARQCRDLLWTATGCNPKDPSSWTRPVVRVGEMALAPFRNAANTPVLHEAFDQLVGAGNWIPRESLGTFPIRFPSPVSANDTGWHVDASFPGDDAMDYMAWRINVFSTGRGLLMLFLFSDVTHNEAPTRIRAGSHGDVARLLAPYHEQGLSFTELAHLLDTLPARKEVLASGAAGTVYLCHPFIVHGAQDHTGVSPKFMAQPPLVTRRELHIDQSAKYPVEIAIQRAIEMRLPG